MVGEVSVWKINKHFVHLSTFCLPFCGQLIYKLVKTYQIIVGNCK